MKVTPLDELTCAAFTAQVQTLFRVCLGAQQFVDLKLSEITPPQVVPTRSNNLASEYFALTFLGPVDPILPQGSYPFESPALGRFNLFIVPAARDAQSTQYQATFNRLVKPV